MSLTPKQTGTFRSFDGTKIYYESRGEGPPIIMSYGISCPMNHWRHQVRYFSKTHRVITYDYRAHHLSEIPENRENLNMDSLAMDLKGLMDHLEIHKAVHFGHSFGVQMLVRHYDLYPEMVDRLVFVNGFVRNPLEGMFGSNVTEQIFQAIKSGYGTLPETISFLWRLGIGNPLSAHLTALLGGFNIQLTSFKDIEVYIRGVASMELDSFIKLFESMLRYDGRPVLPRMDVPVLIIAGQQDGITPKKHQEEVHELIRGSEFFMFPYGSHCTQLDMPDLVNLKIEKFLSTPLNT